MADLAKVELAKLKKSELVDMILENKSKNCINNSANSSDLTNRQSVVREKHDEEDFSDSEDTFLNNSRCDRAACVKVNFHQSFLLKENKTLKNLVTHLEKRLNDQEEIIRLLKLNNVSSKVNKTYSKHVTPTPSTSGLKNIEELNSNISSPHDKSLSDKSKPGQKSYSSVVKTPQISTNMITADQVSAAVNNAQMVTKTRYSSMNHNKGIKTNKIKPVIGTNNNLNQITTIPKLGYLHVYRLGPQTTQDVLMDCLKLTAPNINFSCEKLEKKDNSTTSFKVTFPIKHWREVYAPEIWPDGAAVARFTFPRGRNFHPPASTPPQINS